MYVCCKRILVRALIGQNCLLLQYAQGNRLLDCPSPSQSVMAALRALLPGCAILEDHRLLPVTQPSAGRHGDLDPGTGLDGQFLLYVKFFSILRGSAMRKIAYVSSATSIGIDNAAKR